MPRTHDEQIDRRILEVADYEINTRGLTGMRVADVAEQAGTTVAMIYRRFADRDGLIAATLANYYRSRFQMVIDLARSVLERPGTLTVDDLVDAVPPMRYEGSEVLRHRMQRIYVASVENPALRLTISDVIAEMLPKLESVVLEIAERFPPGRRFDPRIFTIYSFRHNAIIDDILGDAGLSNDDYRDFLRMLLLDSFEHGEDSNDRSSSGPRSIRLTDAHIVRNILPPAVDERDPLVARILTTTQEEIDHRGLVGMRVASIAEQAGTTVSMIYRRFDDRNGLISACLGANLDARMAEIVRMPFTVIEKDGRVTIDDILDAVPPLHYDGSDVVHARRQRIYIAAIEIPELRAAVQEVLSRRLPQFDDAVRLMIDRLPESNRFDARILTVLLIRYNFMLDDVLGPHGLTNLEFRSFLRDLMVRSAHRRRN